MTDKTGGPAFPVVIDLGQSVEYQKGITMRDYFAAQALMGMMSSRNPNSPRFAPDDDAAYVYAVADAMLRARDSA